MTYFAVAFAALTQGYGYGWRFSGARSVQAATSDRAVMGGTVNNRCPLMNES
ncbi:hypothetical protein [Vreelandella sp. EE22]